MSIRLVRLPAEAWSYGTSLACAKSCRLDPSSSHHGAYVDDQGILHYHHIDATAKTTTVLLSFQLQYSAGDGMPYEPISKPWAFEFVPGMPGDVLLVQEGSCRILYASFPKQGAESSDVFLFGSHTAPVTCFSTNGNIVLSGCQDGVLKMWRLSDGQLADMCSMPTGTSITALSTVGPLLVAAGTSSSSITLYDIASGRLLAVQRLMAGPGAVQSLAPWVPSQQLAAANLAAGGPLPPDGGGVLPRLTAADTQEGAGGTAPASHALLAAVSSSGWLCVFEAVLQSTQGWSLIHSTSSLIAPGAAAPQVAFTHDGLSLVVTSPAAQVLGTDAVAAAAAGAHPGAVSLYQVAGGSSSSSSSGALVGLLPPLLLEQQQRVQLPELVLWHQWSLCSMPVGVAVLPSSGFKLLQDKELRPTQVVQLYVVPEVGPGQVLCTERQLTAPASSSAKDSSVYMQQQQQPFSSLPEDAGVDDDKPDAAAAVHGGDAGADMSLLQQQTRAAAVSSSSQASNSNSSSRRSGAVEEDEALLLNIAERDLAEVANAIAAAAGPLDTELSALLAGLTANEHSFAPPAAAAAAPDTAGLHSVSAEAGSSQQPQQQQQRQRQRQEGDRAAAQEPGTAGVGSGGFKLPQTLPAARSWMDARAAGAGPRQAADLDLTALAQQLQEEQQLQQQQQQAKLMQQQQQQQQNLSDINTGSSAASQAGVAAVGIPKSAEVELPSESSFQHLLNKEPGSLQTPSQEQQHLQQQQQEGAPRIHQAAADAPGPTQPPAAHADAADSTSARVEAPAAAEAPAAEATVPAAVTPAAAPDDAATGGSPAAANIDAEPQPRALPAMLRQAPARAAADSAPTPEAGSAVAVGVGVVSRAGPTAVAPGGSSSSGQQQVSHSRPAVVAAAHAEGTHAGAAAQRAAATRIEGQSAQQYKQQHQRPEHEQQQQQQQQEERLQQDAQQPPQQQQQDDGSSLQFNSSTKLSAQQRLTLRRQQVQLRRQQQQQHTSQQAAAAAAAVTHGMSAPGTRGQLLAGNGSSGGRGLVPASDHPLAAAVQNSSRLLAAKIQEAEQAPDITVDPSGPAALKLAAARLTDLDLAPDQQQYNYEELPDLKDIATPTHAPKLVPKQLDAHWVASRSLKPSMDTLFRPEDWQHGFVDPQVLVLPSWATPEQVVQQLLWPGQRPGMWT